MAAFFICDNRNIVGYDPAVLKSGTISKPPRRDQGMVALNVVATFRIRVERMKFPVVNSKTEQ